MGMELGAALVSLLRWVGSVAVIIFVIAVVTLLVDRMRDSRTRSRD